MTRAQCVSQCTPLTIAESLENLQACDDGPENYSDQPWQPLSFGLANFVHTVNGRNLSMKALNSMTDIVSTLANKMVDIILFTPMD